VRPKGNAFAELLGPAEPFVPVQVPHDAMIGSARAPSAGPANAYFPGGAWEYTRTLASLADLAGSRVYLEFEGVYRSAQVFVNGALAGHRPYGYSGFVVRIDEFLRADGQNTIKVEAIAGDDSRWYSGGGLYRNVHLLVCELVHIAPHGVRVTTPDVDDGQAVVEIAATIENESASAERCTLGIEILGPGGEVVARSEAVVTTWPGRPQIVRQRLTVAAPDRWTLDRPVLYTCAVTLKSGADVLDTASTTFGIRTIQVDAERGLRINGETIKLRGACIHHDNGVIGSATVERAEERRVELLKAAGFNALRSSHNPMSEAMLDACDRLGMLVMDEAFDSWTEAKVSNDYAQYFNEWWQADLASMVAKDFNHPSVVLYCIGNEIQDVGRSDGARRTRELADFVRQLDPTRFVTCAINPILACGPEVYAVPGAPPMPELGVNTIMTIMQEWLPMLLQSDLVGDRLEEAYAALDVGGYNYLETRYQMDHDRFPHRVMLGTETMPPLIGRYWPVVRDSPHVIGDFTWTGWDYLGEAGIGRVVRHDAGSPEGFHGSYPWLVAEAGDLDITGFRRPVSYFREIVFGLRTDPYIAVHRPENHGKSAIHQSPWAFTDAIASWSWPESVGCTTSVEVYADGDEVELSLNGAVIGRAQAGELAGYRASFDTTYEPGVLDAVSYRDGVEIGRMNLRSAGDDTQLSVAVDRTVLHADGDVAFLEIALTDNVGIVHMTSDRLVTVTVHGTGVLLGLGSASPDSEESFVTASHRTHLGRALAVVRPTGIGAITVVVSSEGLPTVAVELSVS
jgi:beta-galactosidase